MQGARYWAWLALMLAGAVSAGSAVPAAFASSEPQIFRRHAEGYQVAFPAYCKVAQSEQRLTAVCPASGLSQSEVGKSEEGKDDTFLLEVVTTPVPEVDLTFPSEKLAKAMAKVVCGEPPQRTSLARVDIAFSIGRWPAFDGFVRCTPVDDPASDKIFSVIRFAAGPRMAYWLYTRASQRTKDAAATTASSMYFLSFKPLPE